MAKESTTHILYYENMHTFKPHNTNQIWFYRCFKACQIKQKNNKHSFNKIIKDNTKSFNKAEKLTKKKRQKKCF